MLAALSDTSTVEDTASAVEDTTSTTSVVEDSTVEETAGDSSGEMDR